MSRWWLAFGGVLLSGAAFASVETARLQGEIDRIWRAGGGRVTVERGRHEIGGLRLRSGVTLYLKAGAELIGSRNVSDYDAYGDDALEPLPEWAKTDARWISPARRNKIPGYRPLFLTCAGSRWNRGLICAFGATNIAVIGESGAVIDGANSYDPEGEEGYRGVHGLSFFHCTNVVLRGFTIRHAGNWAMRLQYGADIRCERVTVLGGHDGFHARGCDRVQVEKCVFRTGDDCVGGFDNIGLTVRDCDLSSGANALRLGGRDILVENCRMKGPCDYPFRGSLTTEEKRAGVWEKAKLPHGRYTTATFFLYFCDQTQPVRTAPGNIVVRNCQVENVHRFLRYNFGGETWQHQSPVPKLTFENCHATGLLLPLAANAGERTDPQFVPFVLGLRNCSFGFARPVDAFIECLNVLRLDFSDVRVLGRSNLPAVASWSGVPELSFRRVTGLDPRVIVRDGPYDCIPRNVQRVTTDRLTSDVVRGCL